MGLLSAASGLSLRAWDAHAPCGLHVVGGVIPAVAGVR